MNKKGIALKTAMTLIMGVVFLVVILYILIQTGLLTSFVERINGCILCDFSEECKKETANPKYLSIVEPPKIRYVKE